MNIQKFVVFHCIQKGQQYGIITFYITWQKAKIAFIYSHYEQKKFKLRHCKIWHNIFFGVHNVNNAIFTYCHVINVIMTEKTIPSKIKQYNSMTIKLLKVHEEHKFLSIDFPNYLPIYQNCVKKKKFRNF